MPARIDQASPAQLTGVAGAGFPVAVRKADGGLHRQPYANATLPTHAPAGIRPKKILVLSVSAGAGHLRAAQALCAAGAGEADLDFVHLDVMDFVPPSFRRLYADLYLGLVRHFPAAWGLLYRRSHAMAASTRLHKLRRTIERLCTSRLRKQIALMEPDAIICTHFLPAEMLSYLAPAKRLTCPLWIQVTDFDLHNMWVQPNVDGYFAGNQAVANLLRQRGVSASRIHVTGIPVMPAFCEPQNREQCADQLGIQAGRLTLLLMGGGDGMGSLEQIALALLASQDQIALIVATGKNQALRASLEQRCTQYPGRLAVVGFTKQIERLMACADIVVTKSGGLTTAECLAMGLPMIIINAIPGQEERNADYVIGHGAGLLAENIAALKTQVSKLVSDPESLRRMRLNAAAIGRPNAAVDALQLLRSSLSACH